MMHTIEFDLPLKDVGGRGKDFLFLFSPWAHVARSWGPGGLDSS